MGGEPAVGRFEVRTIERATFAGESRSRREVKPGGSELPYGRASRAAERVAMDEAPQPIAPSRLPYRSRCTPHYSRFKLQLNNLRGCFADDQLIKPDFPLEQCTALLRVV